MKSKFTISIFIFLICFLFQNSYSQQDVNGWRWLNGQPTGNTINWIQIIDASNIFAVADRGTFMKTTDGGDSWSLNSQVGSPDIPATGGGLATRSLNSGWFFDANTGLVGGQSISTNPGILKRTTNGGNTWTQIQYNTVGGTINGFHFLNSTTGYFCGSSPNSKLFKTTDQGLTWTAVPNVPVPDNTYNKVFAFDENKIMLASFPSKIIQTINGGATWSTIILPGAPSNLDVEDVFFKDANTGYACGSPNYFAYSLDGGLNWTQSNAPSSYGQKDLAYNFSNSTLYMAGDITYIFKSINNGVSWTPVQFYDASNPNQPIEYSYMLALSVKGNDMGVVGGAGSVTLSNDGGSSWRNQNYSIFPGNNLYGSIFALGTGNVWAGAYYDGYAQFPTVPVLYSANGGTNWSVQTTSHTAAIRDIEFLNSTTGFIAGGRANIAGFLGEFSKTTNAGNTWTYITLPSPANTLPMFELDFINANTGWVVGGFTGPGYVILKTTNAGASFVSQTLNVSIISAATSVQMLDVNTGYLVAGGGLYKTTNSGTNWIKNLNSFLTSSSWSRVWALTKDIIFLCGPGTSDLKRIVRSTDGGQTWIDLTSDLLPDPLIFKTEWLNLKHGIVVGSNGYTARTTNGGLNWTGSNPGVSTLVSLSLPNKNTLYTVCDRNTAFPLMRKLENITSISLNVNMAIEGFWNGGPMITDSVTVELRNSSSPFGLVDQAKEVVNINGHSTYEFYSAPAGSYYVVLKHRNSLETWSAAPVVMAAGGNYNYDFTTSAAQTFGSNTVLKAGKYCDYSGDVDQNGIVEITDMSLIDNDVFNFEAGYIPTDVNGDGIADLSDMNIADNNVFNFVSVAKP